MGDRAANFVMEKALDAMWQRWRTISDNVTNATTPGYKRKVVNFEESLRAALEEADSKSNLRDKFSILDDVRPMVVEDRLTTMNVDGNNVDIDKEYVELTKTAEQYEYLQRLLNDNYARLRYAITEGRG